VSGFHDVLFPLRLARGAVGGPQRQTEVISLANGREVRASSLAASRRRWEVASAMSGMESLSALLDFFEARRGRLHGFAFRDPFCSSSAGGSAAPTATDQWLGVGDGVRKQFPLLMRRSPLGSADPAAMARQRAGLGRGCGGAVCRVFGDQARRHRQSGRCTGQWCGRAGRLPVRLCGTV
jgi:hypothetical protein